MDANSLYLGRLRHVLCPFLVLLLLLSIVFMSNLCYAEEVTSPEIEDDIDEAWEPDHWEAVYEYLDNSQHMVIWYMMFYNATYDMWMQNGVPERIDYASHSVPSFTFTGTNYHSGSHHFYLYAGTCSLCGGYITRWDFASCPGGGNCILPQNTPDLPE